MLVAGGDVCAHQSPSAPATGSATFSGKTLRQWKADLTHGDASRRTVALMAIMQPVFVDESHTVVPDIVKRLYDTDMSPRAKACVALRTLTIPDDDLSRVIKALASRLYRKNEAEGEIRYEAVSSLRRFASAAGEVTPELINATKDPASWETRHMAAATLWRAVLGIKEGKEGKERTEANAVKALVDQFWGRTTTYEERLEIVIGLGNLGQAGDRSMQKTIVSFLDSVLRSPSASNRPITIWAYAGLVSHGKGDVVDRGLTVIARHLKPEYSLEVRTQAVQALASLGKKAKARLSSIIALLGEKEEPALVDGACAALVRMGDTSDKVVDPLLSLTRQKDPIRAGSAVVALVNLKANKPHVISALEKLLENKELVPGLRNMIEEGLKELKKERPKDEEKKPKALNRPRK
jgi:hypothetical protein